MITGLWSSGDLICALNLGAYNVHQMTVRCHDAATGAIEWYTTPHDSDEVVVA